MRTLTRALILAVLATVALAGCVRYEADVTLHSDNTASGELVLAVSTTVKDRLGLATDQEAFDAVFGSHTFGSALVQSDYVEGEDVGHRYTFDSVPFDELGDFGGLFTVAREGDSIVVSGIQIPAVQSEDETLPEAASATLRIEFPGEVTEHNGTRDGNTVSWDLLTQSEPISAVGSAPSDDGLTRALIGGLIAAASVTVLAAAVILVRRRRSTSTLED